jgi:hypothetical protein
VATGAAPETLLDSYEAERRPVAQAIVSSGDNAEARAARPETAAGRALIQFLADSQGRRLAAIAESEIDFGYGQSPIVDDLMPEPRSPARGTQIGFRVGDAEPLQARKRTLCLHELIAAPGHTMLLLLGVAKEGGAVDEALALASAAARLYRPHVQAYVVARDAVTAEDSSDMLLRDPAGALHERLGADRPCLCLTRLDGHLGLRAAPPSLEALQHHLARILIR